MGIFGKRFPTFPIVIPGPLYSSWSPAAPKFPPTSSFRYGLLKNVVSRKYYLVLKIILMLISVSKHILLKSYSLLGTARLESATSTRTEDKPARCTKAPNLTTVRTGALLPRLPCDRHPQSKNTVNGSFLLLVFPLCGSSFHDSALLWQWHWIRAGCRAA